SLFIAILFFAITKQFVYGLAVGVLGLGVVAGLLLHVSLDILKRLEFKEL
ncbi:MAG: hypothetical protein FJZ76_07955, partial [Bacteroidetes bacterium]|nr:hypothetical protein [Bacteroidota bacterium]